MCSLILIYNVCRRSFSHTIQYSLSEVVLTLSQTIPSGFVINPWPTYFVCLLLGLVWLDQSDTSQTVVLISNQHLSFINSFVYDCKLTFSLFERMIVLNDCLLFYHICYGRACVTSLGNPVLLVLIFSLGFFPKSLLKTRNIDFGIPTSTCMWLSKNAAQREKVLYFSENMKVLMSCVTILIKIKLFQLSFII